ncbi:MAG TPA: nucleotidyltransferase family protein [Longimicrobium sp.]|uniref:nucleotidyltransferase family protein n=1 Tax=Longimicrobium sp. TaxID=2029185 RepID=UPI002ED901FD
MPPPPRPSDALRLRAWSLPLLSGAPPGPPPPVSPDTWDLFLRGERCAIALRAAVVARGHSGDVPAAAARVLEARATRELQRALAARAEILRIGSLLAGRGGHGIVLKGGAAALSGTVLDVQDVDLLVPAGAARELAGCLAAAGYRAAEADPWEGATEAFHLAPRAARGGLAVEVHVRIPYVDEVEPWRDPRPSGVPGIALLPPEDHAWHVLVHAVEHHAERRGCLRDLLLLRAALAACGAGQTALVHERASRHPASAALLAMLDMAGALLAGTPPGDPFRGQAALRYLLAAGGAPFQPGSPRRLAAVAAAAVMIAGEYRTAWLGGPASVITRPSARGSRWLDRHLSVLGWVGRAVWRGTRVALVTPAAARLASAARRAAA